MLRTCKINRRVNSLTPNNENEKKKIKNRNPYVAYEIAEKVARKLNRIPFYPKEWKDSFGLPVEEHKKALETNLTDGYIEFSSAR